MTPIARATRVVLIAAVAKNGVIGVDGKLPWHLPDDLKRFKQLTLGNPIVMGRKTHESIGKALAGRTNVVVTRREDFRADGCVVAHSFDGALDAVKDAAEIAVIGGAELYRTALASADRLELTEVDAAPEGDAFFPDFERSAWRETARVPHPADERHAFAFAFVTLERR